VNEKPKSSNFVDIVYANTRTIRTVKVDCKLMQVIHKIHKNTTFILVSLLVLTLDL